DNIAFVEVNGTPYNVEIHEDTKRMSTPKTPKLVRQEVKNKPGEGHIVQKEGAGGFVVEAPLPGSIFKLLVKDGDTVKRGDVLLVVEAMKMENNIMAEKDGVVQNIKVRQGDSVLQNDFLMVIV
ncbi:MAG TPA: biotin/lipoyl-containing protein, partial [Marinilabiliaceae bacterium]|nr:biotin/lipoyl-containing protein [Marinilabiliaceae bacterium]